MSLSTIAASFEKFAEAVVTDAVAEGKKFGGEVVDDVKEVAEDLAAKGYADFEDLVGKVGQEATQLVTDLMGDVAGDNDTLLSGTAKANLAETTLVQNAAANGIQILAVDATAMIKNAFLAVESKIASL
jgi:hypothetical protein